MALSSSGILLLFYGGLLSDPGLLVAAVCTVFAGTDMHRVASGPPRGER